MRLFGEAQHSHKEVIESIDGQAAEDDELDDDEEHELGMCNAQEVLEANARCRERETLRTYRSAVTAFTNWLVTVKDNLEVKAMVAKILNRGHRVRDVLPQRVPVLGDRNPFTMSGIH